MDLRSRIESARLQSAKINAKDLREPASSDLASLFEQMKHKEKLALGPIHFWDESRHFFPEELGIFRKDLEQAESIPIPWKQLLQDILRRLDEFEKGLPSDIVKASQTLDAFSSFLSDRLLPLDFFEYQFFDPTQLSKKDINILKLHNLKG